MQIAFWSCLPAMTPVRAQPREVDSDTAVQRNIEEAPNHSVNKVVLVTSSSPPHLLCRGASVTPIVLQFLCI